MRFFTTLAGASMVLLSASLAIAQNETPVWSQDQAPMLTQHWTTMKYSSYKDPAMKPTMGMELPKSVTTYDLPESMKMQNASRYRYGMVNDHPVVIESSTRKVVHTWD